MQRLSWERAERRPCRGGKKGRQEEGPQAGHPMSRSNPAPNPHTHPPADVVHRPLALQSSADARGVLACRGEWNEAHVGAGQGGGGRGS